MKNAHEENHPRHEEIIWFITHHLHVHGTPGT
jgi:hypothetical protein